MKRERVYISTIDEAATGLAKEFGLGLEIAEYCTAWNMDEKFDETEEIVQRKVRDIKRCTFHAAFNELFPCAIDKQARELARHRYRQAIALAQEYGAEKVVVHGGYNPWLYYPVWYTEQSIEFWREFLQEVPEDIQICLENVLEEEPNMLLDIIKTVDSPQLRICLDIGHVNSYSKTSVEEWLETCAPYISHFHVHNNDTSWDTHSALTEGTIPMKEFLTRAVALCGEDTTYALELIEATESVHWLVENGLIS